MLCSISTHSSRINDATFHPEGALFLSCSSVGDAHRPLLLSPLAQQPRDPISCDPISYLPPTTRTKACASSTCRTGVRQSLSRPSRYETSPPRDGPPFPSAFRVHRNFDFRLPQDVYAINSVQFHPSGYYALAATEHPISTSPWRPSSAFPVLFFFSCLNPCLSLSPFCNRTAVRMYDTETWRCYASEHAQDHHTAPVTKVNCCREPAWSRKESLHNVTSPPHALPRLADVQIGRQAVRKHMQSRRCQIVGHRQWPLRAVV